MAQVNRSIWRGMAGWGTGTRANAAAGGVPRQRGGPDPLLLKLSLENRSRQCGASDRRINQAQLVHYGK